MNATCPGIWFNDREADHVHRCGHPAGHDSYHWCGHEYVHSDARAQYGVPELCGIGW